MPERSSVFARIFKTYLTYQAALLIFALGMMAGEVWTCVLLWLFKLGRS